MFCFGFFFLLPLGHSWGLLASLLWKEMNRGGGHLWCTKLLNSSNPQKERCQEHNCSLPCPLAGEFLFSPITRCLPTHHSDPQGISSPERCESLAEVSARAQDLKGFVLDASPATRCQPEGRTESIPSSSTQLGRQLEFL